MSRKRRAERTPPTPASGSGSGPIRTAIVLFALALTVRLLFAHATADASWPYSATFKGDAVVWLDYAHALQTGKLYELGLPIHPPGTAYLVAALWNGRTSGLPALRFMWSLFGALIVVLVYVAARGPCGENVARWAGVVCVFATGLLLLSSSIGSETPYLVLALGSLALVHRLRARPGWATALAWGMLGGLACLFRVEHVLAVALTLAWLAATWWRAAPGGASLARLSLTMAGFLLALVPWHVSAWRAIARFNTVLAPETAAQTVPHGVANSEWDEEAASWRDALPAFARPTAAMFVAATVSHRGGPRVTAADTRLLDDAFGYTPRPLRSWPFVSLYGPLNFALANHAGATGGFSTALLEERPPLRPGAASYPEALVAGLPPPQLALVYPPHLRLVNEGVAIGGGWIRAQPRAALGLVARKLTRFWSGAALGFGGYNLPLGLSGVRPAVDLVVPTPSIWSALWQGALLVVTLAGFWTLWARTDVFIPWLALCIAPLLAAIGFFGYARLGATLLPVLSVLWACAFERWVWPRLRARAWPARVALGVALALLLVEGSRFLAHPQVLVDGRPITARADPFPLDLHRDQQLELR